MKKARQIGLICLSLILMYVMAACSSSKGASGDNTKASATPGGDGQTPAATNAPQNKKYTISLLEGDWNPVPKSDGAGLKAIDEKFNIDYKPQLVPMDQADQKIPVVMASGDVPDVIGLGGVDTNFIKWAKQGAFLPLNDYIDKYPQFKLIPKSVWDAVSVDGKIYAIPEYFTSKYRNSAIIRKDWLDKLHLQMPTSYAELLKVAEAFTKQDPDGNGKDDTYGFVTSKGLDWDNRMGVYWTGDAWYHKNDKGQLIPGLISDGSKERIQFMHDAFAEGLVPKDWPVMDYKAARQVFYGGKAGIYYESSSGSTSLFDLLKQNAPNAVVVTLPPFTAPDGSHGRLGLSGWYQMHSLSAKLKDDPGKVDRILSMINYFMTYIPNDQRNPQNPDFDWQNGGVGKGYQFENGAAVIVSGSGHEDEQAARPTEYFINREWAPNDEALLQSTIPGLTNPIQKAYAESVLKEWDQTNYTYIDPTFSIHSDVFDTKFGPLYDKIVDAQTKMIIGQEPMSDWDKMVQDFLKNGGQEIIDDVNQKIKDVGAKGYWK